MPQALQHPQPSIPQVIASCLILGISSLFQRARKTGWRISPSQGEPRHIQTTDGLRAITGKISGCGRVYSVFQHSNGAIEVTFGHARWAGWLCVGIIDHDWQPASGHGPVVYASSQWILDDFRRHSFTIVFLPACSAEGCVTPVLKRGNLVSYEILATDMQGREGVAASIGRP